MHAIRIFLVAVCTVLLTGMTAPTQEKKSTKGKLVGTWELVKSSASDPLLIGLKMEFTGDGTFNCWLKGIDKVFFETTYEVKGDVIRWKKFKGTDNHE